MKLITVPVIDDSESISALAVENLLTELLGDTFEDTVISTSGRVLYVSADVDAQTVSD